MGKNNEEDECIGGLKRQFVARSPQFQSRKSFSPNQVSGAISLGWLRGIQKGEEDMLKQCVKILRRKFPEASKYLRRHGGNYD